MSKFKVGDRVKIVKVLGNNKTWFYLPYLGKTAKILAREYGSWLLDLPGHHGAFKGVSMWWVERCRARVSKQNYMGGLASW